MPCQLHNAPNTRGRVRTFLRRSAFLRKLHTSLWLMHHGVPPPPSYILSPNLWRLRAILRPIGSFPCVVRHQNGARFRLSNDPLDEIILSGMYGSCRDLYFPPALTDIPAGAWILEVGAHHGLYTVAALHRYPAARIISLEPDPSGVRAILRNLRLNGYESRADVICAAVGPTDGVGFLAMPKEGSWANYLASDPSVGHGRTVRTTTLAAVLKGRQPFFVKCNAEGGEYSLFPQLFRLGIRPPWVALFVHPEMGDKNELLELFRSNGYRLQPIASTIDHPRYLCERKG